jgi:hypothetical protein
MDNIVRVAETTCVDFTMQIGAITESVQVAAAAPLVESTTSSMGQNIERRQVQALPLNGRIFSQLITLGPGALASGATNHQYHFDAKGNSVGSEIHLLTC